MGIYSPSTPVNPWYWPGSLDPGPSGWAEAALREASQNAFAIQNPRPTFGNTGQSFISPGSAFSPFGTAAPNALAQNASLAAPVENPFTTISNVKSPSIQSGIDAILASAKKQEWDPLTNTYVTRENVKSQPVQNQINSAVNRYGVDVNNNNQSLKDFINTWQAGNAEAIANQKRDSAAINRVYDPNGLQADLAGNARDQAVRFRQDLNMKLAQSNNATNRARMLRGDSSYLDAQNQGFLSDAVLKEGLLNPQLGRSNILELASQRAGLAGRSNTLLDQALGRGQVPLTLSQMVQGNDASRLGNLTNTNAANNFYTLDSATQQAQQQAQLMAMIQSLNNQNNFYGLRQPRQEDFSGLLPAQYNNLPLPRYPNVQPNRQPSGFPGYTPNYSEPGFGSGVLNGIGNPQNNWQPDWTDPSISGLTRQAQWEQDLAGIPSPIGGIPGGGYSRNPDGSYDLLGNFNYANSNNPADLYLPNWTPQSGFNPYD